MSDLKKVIRQEYLKCAKDPSHFMKKYCQIQHPQRGRIQFNLYPSGTLPGSEYILPLPYKLAKS